MVKLTRKEKNMLIKKGFGPGGLQWIQDLYDQQEKTIFNLKSGLDRHLITFEEAGYVLDCHQSCGRPINLHSKDKPKNNFLVVATSVLVGYRQKKLSYCVAVEVYDHHPFKNLPFITKIVKKGVA